MQGYIKLHRGILDNPLFKSEPYTKGQAWITLLLLTNHKEGYISIKNGEMIKIERGECGYSELALSDIFKWSRGKVNRFLKLLENEKMIQQKNISNRNIIKILNYELYQNDTVNSTVNSTVNDTVNGHLTIHQTDINKNDNNDKNEKNDKKFLLNTDPFLNPIKETFLNEFEKQTGKRPRLTLQECNKLIELSEEQPDFLELIPEAIKKLTEIDFKAINFKPSANWLLKDNNFVRVLNDEFSQEEQKSPQQLYLERMRRERREQTQ